MATPEKKAVNGDPDAEPPKSPFTLKIDKALADASVPHHYANGFTNGSSSADVVILFERAGTPVATVNMSFALAKTLAQRLGQLVIEIEGAIGTEIPSTDTIEQAFKNRKQKKEIK